MVKLGSMDLGSLVSRFTPEGSSFSIVYFIFKAITILAVIIVGIWLIARSLSYNIEVRIKSIRGNNIVEIKDKAKRIKTKSGFRCLQLLKGKVKLPIPEPRYFSLGTETALFGLINRPVQVLNYIKYGEYDYAVLQEEIEKIKAVKKEIKDKEEIKKAIYKIEEEYTNNFAKKLITINSSNFRKFMLSLTFTAIPQDVFGTAVQEVRLAPQRFIRKLSFIEKYGYHMAGFLVLVFMLVAIWIITKHWGDAMSAGVSNLARVAAG
jgi:hypothetical protein